MTGEETTWVAPRGTVGSELTPTNFIGALAQAKAAHRRPFHSGFRASACMIILGLARDCVANTVRRW